MKVAVLLPVFNCENTINQTLESILNQSHSNFSLYVINNNCTDKTIANILSYSDDRIKIFNYFDKQMCSAALNYGLDIIEEKYIVRVDGDDIYHADYIKTYLKSILHNNHKIVYGSYLVKKNNKIIADTKCIQDKDLLIWRLLFFNTVNHNVIYDKDFILSVGKYNLLQHSEDYDLWQRCILKDLNSITGTEPAFYSSLCYKGDACMTSTYGNNHDLTLTLSKNFINKFLNVKISNELIKKIRLKERLSARETVIMGNLLKVYLNKMNIANQKFLNNKNHFLFYV
jgi:glycosyltransferase involved in cell wall biosynthesis